MSALPRGGLCKSPVTSFSLLLQPILDGTQLERCNSFRKWFSKAPTRPCSESGFVEKKKRTTSLACHLELSSKSETPADLSGKRQSQWLHRIQSVVRAVQSPGWEVPQIGPREPNDACCNLELTSLSLNASAALNRLYVRDQSLRVCER